MHRDWLEDERAFRDRVAERLTGVRFDASREMRLVEERRAGGRRWAPSAVLIPLRFDRSRSGPVVVLNKRSDRVQQPGDLCFPGGGLNRRNDRILGLLLVWRILPTCRSAPFRSLAGLSDRDPQNKILLTLFASVLRESWEEMRLPPWKVEYLGCLRPHSMASFPRTIFPVVGRVLGSWEGRPNWEVEKILSVPFRSFFDPGRYGLCRMLLPAAGGGEAAEWETPCFVVHDRGQEEVLWGATFQILSRFLETVADFSPSDVHPRRVLVRTLPAHYFTGKTGVWRGRGAPSGGLTSGGGQRPR